MAFLSPSFSVSALPVNSNAAFTNSWVSVGNDQGHPLFAQATVPLAANYNFDIITDTNFYYGNYTKIVTLASTVISNLTASGNVISGISSATFPANFVLESSVQGIKLTSGQVIAYK